MKIKNILNDSQKWALKVLVVVLVLLFLVIVFQSAMVLILPNP